MYTLLLCHFIYKRFEWAINTLALAASNLPISMCIYLGTTTKIWRWCCWNIKCKQMRESTSGHSGNVNKYEHESAASHKFQLNNFVRKEIEIFLIIFFFRSIVYCKLIGNFCKWSTFQAMWQHLRQQFDCPSLLPFVVAPAGANESCNKLISLKCLTVLTRNNDIWMINTFHILVFSTTNTCKVN